jgi:Bacterial Ig domain
MISVGTIIIFICIPAPFAISQIPDISNYKVRITFPEDGQMVPVGELTIHGTASYNGTISDCTVYADWNDIQPMQKVMPAGPNYKNNDYSKWIFTYTDKYHLISEGANELTAKLSCDVGPFNSTKYYSVNIFGIP